jgi:LacI family transcriptional regulator/LacI family repressor for deo operon, udp, cdd, tsx, nupC, and nupG
MATIKQVADMARVSTATVSYVLNGTGTVTEPVRQRVLEAAAALDYQPSYAARSLRTHARTLGLVLPALPGYVADPLLAELLSGISEGAAARGYYVLLATARAEEPDAQLAARLVRSGRVDGVVLLDLLADDERAAALRAQNVPHVCAGQPAGAGTEASPFVAVDGRQGALLATRHLLGIGHRRVAMIALPSDLADSEPRQQGYAEALEEAGAPFAPELVVEAGRTNADGYAAMQELLGLPEPPDAVLACSDALALGALHALRDADVEVGRDVSLVGWDDAPLAAHIHPALTTLRYDRQALGAQLAATLIAVAEHRDDEPRGTLLPMRLVIRKSTRNTRLP